VQALQNLCRMLKQLQAILAALQCRRCMPTAVIDLQLCKIMFSMGHLEEMVGMKFNNVSSVHMIPLFGNRGAEQAATRMPCTLEYRNCHYVTAYGIKPRLFHCHDVTAHGITPRLFQLLTVYITFNERISLSMPSIVDA
jgi:hypothetical protein